MTIIYMRHIRAAKLCASGARQWAESNGHSWGDFLANGIHIDALANANDPFATKIKQIAQEESQNGQ